MEKVSQVMKRIPRIKFPQRHTTPSSTGLATSQNQPLIDNDAAVVAFFSSLKASATTNLGGKASLQPKRTPVSKDEIEAILLGGCF